MIGSIIGQNERWAQLSATQPPAAAQTGRPDPWAVTGAAPTVSGANAVAPVSGNSGAPLSDNMSFMLMVFDGGAGSATGTTSATTGSPAGASAAPGTTGSTAAGGVDGGLLSDIQSLLSALSDQPSPSATASSVQPAQQGPGGDLSSTLLKDMQAIESDLGTIAAASSGAARPSAPPASAPPSSSPSSAGQQRRDTDGDMDGSGAGGVGTITTPGSANAEPQPAWRHGWDEQSGSGAGWQQQFGLGAYMSAGQPGVTSATASTLQSLSV